MNSESSLVGNVGVSAGGTAKFIKLSFSVGAEDRMTVQIKPVEGAFAGTEDLPVSIPRHL